MAPTELDGTGLTSDTSTASPRRGEQRVLRAIVTGASIYAGFAAGLAVLMTYVLLSSALSDGAAPAIELPIGLGSATEVPSLTADPATPGAHFSAVEFTARGLSPPAQLLFFSSRALTPLLHAIIGVCIARFAVAALSGRPFGQGATRPLLVSAVSVALIGSATQFLDELGTSMARHELLADTPLAEGWVSGLAFDWTPILAAAGVVVVAVVIRVGARMQRDTEGLV